MKSIRFTIIFVDFFFLWVYVITMPFSICKFLKVKPMSKMIIVKDFFFGVNTKGKLDNGFVHP